MKPDIYRSYKRDISSKIEGHWDRIGWVRDYPLFYVRKGTGEQHVIVTGGVHGDEPAGMFAALEFEPTAEEMENFTLHIYPCMNPWGWECNKRENAEGIDLNRGFKEEIEGEECKLFAQHVIDLNHKFVFTIDFHEGSPNYEWKGFDTSLNPRGAWLYESCHDKAIRMGDQMIGEVERYGMDVAKQETVYGDINNGGVIWYPEGMKSVDYATQDSFDAWLWKDHTNQSFTSETDMTWDLENRILAHHLMLHKALEIKING